MRAIANRFASAALALALIASPSAGLCQPASGGHGSGGSSAPAQSGQTRQERLTSAESFVPLPTFSSTVLQNGVTRGTLVVDMGLDAPDAALRARAIANGPRLRDAIRTALSTYAAAYFRAQTAPDPTTMGRLLQQSVDRTLGAPGARVLFTNIVYQGGGRRT